MNKEEFSILLKRVDLTRQEFSDLSNTPYTTISKWNDTNRPIPNWVESWLKNYEKSKFYDDIKNKISEIEGKNL